MKNIIEKEYHLEPLPNNALDVLKRIEELTEEGDYKTLEEYLRSLLPYLPEGVTAINAPGERDGEIVLVQITPDSDNQGDDSESIGFGEFIGYLVKQVKIGSTLED